MFYVDHIINSSFTYRRRFSLYVMVVSQALIFRNSRWHKSRIAESVPHKLWFAKTALLLIQHSRVWNRNKSCPLGYYRDLFYFYKIAQLDSLKSLHFDPIVNIHKDVHCIHKYMEPCITQDSEWCMLIHCTCLKLYI